MLILWRPECVESLLPIHGFNISSYARRVPNLVWKRFSSLLEGRGEENMSIQDAGPGGMSKPCFRRLEFMKRKQLIFFFNLRKTWSFNAQENYWNLVSLKSIFEKEKTIDNGGEALCVSLEKLKSRTKINPSMRISWLHFGRRCAVS